MASARPYGLGMRGMKCAVTGSSHARATVGASDSIGGRSTKGPAGIGSLGSIPLCYQFPRGSSESGSGENQPESPRGPDSLGRMGFRRHGPFQVGDQVQLTDPKNKRHTVTLKQDGVFHTHKGAIPHSDLIGQPEGSVVRSSGGTQYLAFRHLLADYTLSMPRGAAVVYPKDAAEIVAMADVFPGARVVEAG